MKMRDLMDRARGIHGNSPYSDEELDAMMGYRAGGGPIEGQDEMIRDMRAGRDPMADLKPSKKVHDMGTRPRLKDVRAEIAAEDFLADLRSHPNSVK